MSENPSADTPPVKGKKKKKMSPMHLWRRVTQFSFLLLLNPYWFAYLGFCFPVMNCWACPAAAFGCPVGAIGEFLALGMIPFLTIGLMVLAGALIGRMLCGWVCPFGLIQDLMHRIPVPFLRKKLKFPYALTYAKYAFLILCVIWIPMQYGIRKAEDRVTASDFFFCHICPAGTLEAAIPVNLGLSRLMPEVDEAAAEGEEGEENVKAPSDPGGLPLAVGSEEEDPFAEDDPFAPGGGAMGNEDDPFGSSGTGDVDLLGEEEGGEETAGGAGTGEFVPGGAVTAGADGTDWGEFLLKPRMWILYAFLAMFILFQRPFCRGMCPIGAIFAVLNKVSFLRLRVDKQSCKDCNLCAKVCPAGNRLCDNPSNQDCVRCLECVSACKLDAAKVGVIRPEKKADYWE